MDIHSLRFNRDELKCSRVCGGDLKLFIFFSVMWVSPTGRTVFDDRHIGAIQGGSNQPMWLFGILNAACVREELNFKFNSFTFKQPYVASGCPSQTVQV